MLRSITPKRASRPSDASVDPRAMRLIGYHLAAVPEPGSPVLLGLGVVGIGLLGRARRRPRAA